MYYRREIDSPAGPLTLVTDGRALCGVFFTPPRFCPNCLREARPEPAEHRILDGAEEWLRAYFAGACPRPSALPLHAEGTAFQSLIWRLLEEIPYGTTVTYGELAARAARQLGREHMSAQAVGNAVGHNPLAIILPCHRVVAEGGLGGFSGGEAVKRMLLQHEGIL